MTPLIELLVENHAKFWREPSLWGAEFRVRILLRPGVEIKARFQLEDRLRSAAEIFRTLQAEAAAGPDPDASFVTE